MNKNALSHMEDALGTFKERNAVYKDSYILHGDIMRELFPEGIQLRTEEDFRRFGVINGIVGKLNRYCRNFEEGGHEDSAHDLGVMGFILQELTEK